MVSCELQRGQGTTSRATALLAFCREQLQALETQVQRLDASTDQLTAWSAA